MKFDNKIIKKIYSLLVKFRNIIYVLKDSLSIRNKKVLFCDLGANIGSTYLFFKKFYKNATFFLFEPNVNCYKKLLQLTDRHHSMVYVKNVAVSSVSGTFKFFLGGSLNDEFSESGSISENYFRALKKKKEKNKKNKKQIFLKAINFNSFLKKNSKNFDKIVVKMDIEGAELNLIESLIKNKTLTMIDILYVEFHSNYVKKNQHMKFKNRELKIISYIKEKTNITLRMWH